MLILLNMGNGDKTSSGSIDSCWNNETKPEHKGDICMLEFLPSAASHSIRIV